MVVLRPVVVAACFGLALPPATAVTHYERPPCQTDEVQGEVLGVSGYVCAPRCSESSYDCPNDVPDLAAARPQCMLKDADQFAYCALLCTVDSQCPSSARCNRMQQAGVGVCMYPLAFSDWVRQGNTKRLSFGLPQRADKKVPQGVVQKAVSAVQNLKSKYGIQDGDADVVTVKEFLTTLSGGSVLASPGSGIVPAASGPVGGFAPAPPPVAPPPQGSSSSSDPLGLSGAMGAYQRDFNYHTNRLKEGIPGVGREVNDMIYDAEHLTQKWAAQELLRRLVELFLVYLVIGVAYKHQALGARGIDMIPHIGFWMEYPQLVHDGITYSQIVAGEYLGMDLGASSRSGGFGGGGFEPLGRERDTFAQFEPSK